MYSFHKHDILSLVHLFFFPKHIMLDECKKKLISNASMQLVSNVP